MASSSSSSRLPEYSLGHSNDTGVFQVISATLQSANATPLFLYAQCSMMDTEKIATNNALFLLWKAHQDKAWVNDPSNVSEVARKFKRDRDRSTFLDGFPLQEWFAQYAALYVKHTLRS